MQNSPRPRREAPSHDDMNTPMRKMKVMEVTNPRPARDEIKITSHHFARH
jgi:hypothetical protein